MPMSPRLLRPQPSRGFNPRSLSGLAVWLDASDASTLFQNSNATTAASATNDPIGCWANKAGPTNAIQSTNLNRPQYKPASQNGRGTIYLDGVNGFLTLAYDLPSPFTLISAQKIEAATGAAFALIGNLQNSGNFDGLLHIHSTSSNTTTVATRIRTGAIAYSTSETTLGTAWSTWVTTITGSTFRARVNRVQLSDGPAQTYTLRDTTISIGRSRTADATFVRAVSFAEILLYTRVLSATEITTAENYLKTKWNLP